MRQRMIQALMGQQPGMAGTQGGPVDESPLMDLERNIQRLAGAGTVTAAGLGQWMGDDPFSFPVTAAMFAGGAKAMRNADEHNIRDVWTDQMRQKIRGRR